jgi:hypothetical protein
MMSEFELALQELESATAAVAGVAIEDFAEAQAAMDRRSWAIADLSALAAAPLALPERTRQEAVRRLRLASEAGDKAAQRLTAARSAAMVEWNQWSRIYRALGAAGALKPARVDCRG